MTAAPKPSASPMTPNAAVIAGAATCSVNSISPHAVARFRQRCAGKSDAVIRRDITGLIYSAHEVKRKTGAPRNDGSRYWFVDGIVFVVKAGVVATVLFDHYSQWERVNSPNESSSGAADN